MKVPAAASAQSVHLLKGWLEVPNRKVSQNLQFFKLRSFLDDTSLSTRTVQLVSRHANETALSQKLQKLQPESCVAVQCRRLLKPVESRRAGWLQKPSLMMQAESIHRRVNHLAAPEENEGDYEYEIEDIHILNAVTEPLPFLPNEEANVDTLVRARHRTIEMRSDSLGGALRLRSQLKSSLRQHLQSIGFLEVETPLLFKSTPEGAREFLVPTRRRGEFFALPQSPQQYKQMLMAGGIRRYYQFAKCFRDEDSRADRQLEFTQLDLEMSFAGAEEVMQAVSQMVLHVAAAWGQPDLFATRQDQVIPRMTYMDAMARYGSDKPDLTFGLEIWSERLDDDWHGKGEPTLVELIAVPVPGHGQSLSSRAFKQLQTLLARDAPGVVAIKVSQEQKLPDMLEPAREHIDRYLSTQPSTAFFLAHTRNVSVSGGATKLGTARLLLQTFLEQQGYTDTPRWTPSSTQPRPPLHLLWVTDFPLFSPLTQDEVGQAGTRGLCSTHHPFTAPHPDDAAILTHDAPLETLLQVRGLHYDLVMNGCEIGGGSVRIHDPVLQNRVLDTLGVASSKRAGFAHLLKALGSGCPPHAGFALGFDRFLSIVLAKTSIREVIAFPKTSGGLDPLVNAPSAVDAETLLRDYHLKVAS
ncbi:tRNA synthetases class II-domain-containing protein [Protomyces lactucae-debilis]|uniref:tRNA synthetases class II-domain-containing protein n=1 Tax=Protomyces lactucae-debilis TaxID=2754530 RepID=A0A1Y2F3X9_PROLT|nr:tRNA synthetases class II-domain-containing protein [Protomyces lactucae-debilis]ORY78610.1 tRNA synthetases class II-domain-containing protein [Protomyces lactucae-debilis]